MKSLTRKYKWLLIVTILFLAALAWRQSSPQRASGGMRQEAYVWQRVWTDEVKESVERNRDNFAGYTVQVADFTWADSGQWKANYFADAIDYAAQNDVTIAVRIGASAAHSEYGNWHDSQTVEMVSIISKLLESLPNCDTIQIDYDCPSAKLTQYAKLLKALRQKLPEHKIEFTALPDWIRQDSFGSLTELADRYVIQVHGVSGYSQEKLCDPAQAKWVAEECGKLSTPFLIALPTYQHLVARNTESKIIEVISEGSAINPKLHYEFISANKSDLTHLIQLWTVDRPAKMQGVIWYRLPIAGEEMNWTIDTLKMVMQGDPLPSVKITSKAVLQENGSYEIFLVNESLQRLHWPAQISIQWEDGFCIAGEANALYSLTTLQRSGGQAGMILGWKRRAPYMIAPKSRVSIGWIRLDKKSNITVKLKNS